MNIRSPLSLPDLLSASPDQNVALPRPTRTRFSRAVSASPDQKAGRSTKTPSPSISPPPSRSTSRSRRVAIRPTKTPPRAVHSVSPMPSRSTSRSRHVAIRPTYLRLARPLGLPTSRSPDLRVSRPPGLHELTSRSPRPPGLTTSGSVRPPGIPTSGCHDLQSSPPPRSSSTPPRSSSPPPRSSSPQPRSSSPPYRTTSDHDLRVPSCTNPEYGLQVPPRTTTTSPLGLLRFLLKKGSGIGQPHSAQPL